MKVKANCVKVDVDYAAVRKELTARREWNTAERMEQFSD